jgi:uncharacterized membrane protein
MNPYQFSHLSPLTIVAFAVHIAGGTLGVISGLIAVFARKGERLHRAAGKVFTVSMLFMAVAAGYLAVVRPGQLANLVTAATVFYLIVTAWLTAQRKDGERAGLPEKIALGFVVLLLFVPFAGLSFLSVIGKAPANIHDATAIFVYIFTGVIGLAAMTDLRVVLGAGLAGAARVARHLWRMCLALMLAVESFVLNAIPRILPFKVHLTAAWFVPQFLVLALLFFWLARVWFTRQFKAQAQPAE